MTNKRHTAPGDVTRRQLLVAAGAGLAFGVLPGSSMAAAKAGTIRGRIRFGGRAGKPSKVKLSGDCAYCRSFDLRREDLLVGQGNGLRNVVVTLDGLANRGSPSDAMPVLAEHRCTFEPHVMSVTVPCKLLLHNRDPVLNTFHAVDMATGRTLFNIGTPTKDQKVKRRLRRPGLVKVLCDVHPWEVAYIVACNHPFHAVTDEKGGFVLANVPAGSHTVTLWHEQLGTRKQKVTVGPETAAALNLTWPPKGQ